jgi:4-amino-4-deoxy-L-arabinose transferase-like glycosyltransferase
MAGEMRHEAAVLCAILALALSLQVALIVARAEPSGGGGADSLEYSRHAMSLLRRGVYSFDGVTPDRMRQPVYPLFLAGVYAVFGVQNHPVYLLQALINTATVCLVWRLARMLSVSPPAALGAALLVAAYPPFVCLSGLVLTESLSTFLLMGAAMLFVRTTGRPGAGPAVALGLVVGLHTLCRPVTALLPVFLVPLWWLVLGSARRAIRTGLLAGLGFLLAMAPWGLRNALTLGQPTVLSTEGGAGMYVGTRADAEEIWDQGLMPFIGSDEVRAIIGDDYYLSETADARFRATALARILQHPGEVLLHGAVQVLKAWVYMPGARVVSRGSPWLWIPLVGIPSALLALATYGALSSRNRAMAALVLGLPAYYSAVLLLLFSVPRHVLPLFPLIAIGAAAGTARILARRAPARVGLAGWPAGPVPTERP